MKKLIEVKELLNALHDAGLEAGICAPGSSSYPFLRLAGDMEIWAYIPDPEWAEAEELIGVETLRSIE